MELKVSGNSGVNVSIVDSQNNIYIRKYTQDKSKHERLIKQAEKQKNFTTNVPNIKIPKIYSIEKCDPKIYLKNKNESILNVNMEYVYSYNFMEFFENVDKHDLDSFINCVIGFIEDEIDRSNYEIVDKKVIISKIDEVYGKLVSNGVMCENNNDLVYRIVNKIKNIVSDLPDQIVIPVGICHGDFTYSNILFKGNDYYLIDFLDCYIESPIMDIVKIRQDSFFGWSNIMYKESYDLNRITIINDYVDKRIDEHFSKYAWYKFYYNTFQIINMLRILPYCKKDDSKYIFVIDCLKKIL